MKKKNKDKNKKNLVFFQSISEIPTIITLLNKYSFGKCILIVTGGFHFLKVLKRLNIKKKFGIKVYAFHGLSLKNPINIFRMYYNFYHSKNSKELLKYNFEKAFYFSEYEDFVSPIFLSRINIQKVILIDNLNNIFSKRETILNFKNKLKSIFIRFLLIRTNVKISFRNLKFSTQKTSRSIQLPYYYSLNKKIFKKKPLKIKLPSEYMFQIDKKFLKKKNIMYIDSNDEEMIGIEFNKIINTIIRKFKELNFNIIIKKPTRENLSPSLSSKRDFKYISDPTPIELYDLKKIQFVFGFMTTALSKVSSINSNIKIFSIVNLLSKNKRKEFSKLTYNFHKNLKNKKGKIFYPYNINEILKMVKK